MKTWTIMRIPVIAALVLLFICNSFGFSIKENVTAASGKYTWNKTTVRVKDTYGSENNSFSLKDMEQLEKELGSTALTYTAQTDSSVSYKNLSYKAKVVGVDYRYRDFEKIRLGKGSFFTKKTQDEGDLLAVVDERLAVKIFGTTQIVGATVKIFQKPFKIIGIAKSDVSIISRFADNGTDCIYVPAAALLNERKDIGITQIHIGEIANGSSQREKAAVANAVNNLGKNREEYRVIDYAAIMEIIGQKPELTTFLIGIIIIGILAVYFKKEIKKASALHSESKHTDQRREMAACIFKLIFIIVATVSVIKGILFEFHACTPGLSGEAGKHFSFIDLVRANLSAASLDGGQMNFQFEQLLSSAESIVNYSCGASILIILFLLAVRQKKMSGLIANDTKPIYAAAATTAAALVAAPLVCMLFGIPINMQLKDIFIYCGFVFIYIIF